MVEDSMKIGEDVRPGAVRTGFRVLEGKQWRDLPDGDVIEEVECCIYVNGQELVTLAATPVQLEALAVGFLANESLIQGMDEVQEVTLRGRGYCLDVWLKHAIKMPERRIKTSGCTGGVTFDELAHKQEPLDFGITASVEDLNAAARALYAGGELYRQTRGVHTSILWRDGAVLALAEDVGRHNTLDKLHGACMLAGITTRGSLLVSTGRISSEMLSKAVRMGCPVVVSRTSSTSLSVQLAREWNVTLVGYLRSNINGSHGWRMIVYSHPDQIITSTDG
jgi:FdhD protein